MSDTASLAPRPRLVALSGRDAGAAFDLGEQPLTLGRSSANHISLPSASVSRKHAQVEWREGRALLSDLGSRSGTLVNGQAVVELELSPGDVVAIGGVELVFLVGDTDSTPLGLLDEPVTMTGETTIASTDSLLLRPGDWLSDSRAGKVSSDLEPLLRLAQAVAERRDVESLGSALLDAVLRATPAERAGLFLVGSSGALHPVLAASRDPSSSRELRASRTIAARVVAERVALLDDMEGEDPDAPPSLAGTGIRGFACAPLILDERAIGILWLETDRDSSMLNRAHLDIAAALCTLVAMPFDAARRALPEGVASSKSAELAALALVLDPAAPLDLGTALSLMSPSNLAPIDGALPVLVLDWTTPARGGSALSPAVLERLALIPEGVAMRPALASEAPSIARLAALVASLSGSDGLPQSDARAWFRDVLTASSLLALRAKHVVLESRAARAASTSEAGVKLAGLPLRHPGPRPALLFARRLAKGLKSAEPFRWSAPDPWPSMHPPFLALDGEGPMSGSARGSILVSDTPDLVARKIRSARTDSGPVLDPERAMGPELRNLLLLHHAVSGDAMGTLLQRFAGKGHGVLKAELADVTNAWLDPVRKRRDALGRSDDLADSLRNGTEALEASAREACALIARTPGLLR